MKTEIMVVLDRSGSMHGVRSDMEGGLNQFIREQQKVPGECYFSLLQFDGTMEWVFRGVPMAGVWPTVQLIPRGSTALNDAVGMAINEMDRRLAYTQQANIYTPFTPYRVEPQARVIFIVITDGEENASREFTKAGLRALIAARRWEFVFLGANIDAFTEGAQYGFTAATTMTYAQTPGGIRATFDGLSQNSAAIRSGAATTMAWTDEQRTAQDKELKK